MLSTKSTPCALPNSHCWFTNSLRRFHPHPESYALSVSCPLVPTESQKTQCISCFWFRNLAPLRPPPFPGSTSVRLLCSFHILLLFPAHTRPPRRASHAQAPTAALPARTFPSRYQQTSRAMLFTSIDLRGLGGRHMQPSRSHQISRCTFGVWWISLEVVCACALKGLRVSGFG